MTIPHNPWATDQGVYLGHMLNEPVEEPKGKTRLATDWNVQAGQFNRYAGPGNLVTIGPTGSGKTRKLLVPNLHRLTGWSVVCVDPKGQLAVWTAKHRYDAGNEVITFDPFGVIARRYPGLVKQYPYLKSRSFNPLAMLDPGNGTLKRPGDDFPDDAKKIGEAVIKVEGKDPHWSRSAQALVAGLAMALRVKSDGQASLADLRRVISKEPGELADYIKTGLLADLPEGQDAIPSKLSRFSKFSPENGELASVLATAITQTDWLDSKPIQRALAHGTYNFATLKRGATREDGRENCPTTIYLVLPPRYLETHATWLRLMITAMLMPLIRSTGGKVPVLVALDEFAQLGSLEVIEQNMALTRDYGVKLWLVLQDLAQLKNIYQGRWESFIGNAGMLQSFAPQDMTTREYLSKLSGKRFYWLPTTSTSTSQQTGGGGHSQSTSEQTGENHVLDAVYPEQSLAQMKGQQSVLLPAGYAPRRTWLPDPAENRPGVPQLPEVWKMLAAAQAEADSYEVQED